MFQIRLPRRWISAGDDGGVSLSQFPINFTLLSHAGWAGLIFGAIWVGFHASYLTYYNYEVFTVVAAFFLVLLIVAPLIAINISSKKLTLSVPAKDFNWFQYARIWMALLLIVFCLDCSLLIWGTGGISSPFVPFYIMVFLLALGYCRFPQPARVLTLTFVGIFLIFIVISEVPGLRGLIPPPIDDATQNIINNLYQKRFFEGGFMVASMLVPLISMQLAAWRTGSDALPAATEAATPVADNALSSSTNQASPTATAATEVVQNTPPNTGQNSSTTVGHTPEKS